MSDALTNAGRHVLSNIACVQSQQYTKDPFFCLADMTLHYDVTSHPTICQAKRHLRWTDKRVGNALQPAGVPEGLVLAVRVLKLLL